MNEFFEDEAEPSWRTCLYCGEDFWSPHAGRRICCDCERSDTDLLGLYRQCVWCGRLRIKAGEEQTIADANQEVEGKNLVEYARLLNVHGPDSDEAKRFIQEHEEDEEFAQLAELSRTLKKALNRRR
mgnify:CR=1 FL=1